MSSYHTLNEGNKRGQGACPNIVLLHFQTHLCSTLLPLRVAYDEHTPPTSGISLASDFNEADGNFGG